MNKNKQHKYLYRRMIDENLIREAYKRLRKGKTTRSEIIYIDAHLSEEVARMRTMIENTKPVEVEHPELAFKARKREPRRIVENGKERTIYIPEIHEQWLHHIIVMVLEPIIIRSSYKYSCGSIPKRGSHYGKRQIVRWLKQNQKSTRYFAKLDIRHFFNNIQIKIAINNLRRIIKDEWFIHVLKECMSGFKKGIPLGFYISQWIANYFLEGLDRYITDKLGLKLYIRYMDDMVIFSSNKKKLSKAIISIKEYLGRYLRLKLKRNWQVCRFEYQKNGKTIGRKLDFMGFVFSRNCVTMRKSIMLKATRNARLLLKEKRVNNKYYMKRIQSMLSYMGWFSNTDTYDCYLKYVKPYVDVRKLKQIISKIQRRNHSECMEERKMLSATGRTAANR